MISTGDFWSATQNPLGILGYSSHYYSTHCTNVIWDDIDGNYSHYVAFEILPGAVATTTPQILSVGREMEGFLPLVHSGGAWPYTYSYTGTLPDGLSFNTSTGVVIGTPTATYATADMVFSVTDANNSVVSTTSTVSFTVGEGAFTAVTGGCLLDNLTGLMWEQKTTDGGLRDWTKTYTNYSAAYNSSLQYGTSTDATGFVTAVNATNLCGYSDWRLPTVSELQSIVVSNVGSPTIDTFWFPITQGYAYWSSTPNYYYNTDAAGVDFSSGTVFGEYTTELGTTWRGAHHYVRVVR